MTASPATCLAVSLDYWPLIGGRSAMLAYADVVVVAACTIDYCFAYV